MTTRKIDHFACVDGRRLHCRESGDPSGPTAIILHGIMGHVREWDTVAEMLEPTHHVIAVDQRGHGHSDWADEYTASAMADDLLDLVEQLDLAPDLLVGHSMGGMAAMLAVATRPWLARRLVLLDVGPHIVTPEVGAELAAWLDLLAASSYATVDEAVQVWLDGDEFARPDLLRHYVIHALRRRGDGRLVWRFDAAGLARFPVDGVSADQLQAAVREIEVPTLVVRGQHSPFLSADAARRLVTDLRRAVLVEVPDAGHDLGVQQPEAVATAILETFPRQASNRIRQAGLLT